MIEDRDLFEGAVQRFAPPDGSFERLVSRRDRKQRNKRIAAGVVALLLTLVVIGAALRAIDVSTPTPLTPSPSPSASNGDVAFVGSNLIDFSDDLNDFGILFVVDPAGGKPRKLLDTECPADPDVTTSCGLVGIGSVDWSPDGTRIAYTLFGGGPGSSGERDGIYVMEIENERVHQVTSCTDPCVYLRDLDWSPDGSRIAYEQSDLDGCTTRGDASSDGTCHSLYTTTLDGSDPVDLPTGSVVDPVDPSWSPDGRSIALSGRVGENWFVFTMAVDGSDLVRLAADLPSPQQTQPAWSPDGSRIAFVTWEGAAPGSKPTQLDFETGLPFALWSMASDGSERRRLYEGCCMIGGAGFGVEGPVWSPDGTQILLMTGTGGGVVVIDAETGEAFEIPGRKPTGPIAWQPVP
jgi:dipeptidyl aminopeptidase/acylaminoacyl peptidase